MRSTYLVFATLLLVLSCASAPPVRGKKVGLQGGDAARNIKIEPEARTLFYQAERQYLTQKYDPAMEGFRRVKAKFPFGKAHMLASYRLGSIYYLKGLYPLASKEFEYFLSKYPQSELGFDITYNWAASEYQQANYSRAYDILAQLKLAEVQAQAPKRAEVVLQLASQVALALNNHAGVIAAYAAQLALPMDEPRRMKLENSIDDHLLNVNDRDVLQQLVVDIQEPSTKAKISQRLASLNSGTQAPIETAAAVTPANDLNRPISSATNLASGGSSGDRTALGVVLPLTGKQAAYGKRALEGVMLAAQVLRKNSPNFRLFVEDSASNSAMAEEAVEELFFRHRAMAIVGPLGRKESVAVAEKALELGIPNISLTNRGGLSQKGAYLFQNALTPAVQLDNMVRYAISERQVKRFGILWPQNNFGEDMKNDFWALVEKYGGHIVGEAAYRPDEKDFQKDIRKLFGLENPLIQSKLAAFAREQKKKTGKEPKARQIPIVDFDALFIPDSPKVVAQIAASLAYHDVTGVTLMGTTEWNSVELYKRAGRYVEGAIFPGGVSAKNPKQKEFVRAFTETYGEAPDLLAMQAFEAMDMVIAGLRASGSGDRNALAKEISQFKNFPSPLGNFSMDETRLAKRSIPVFILQPGGAVSEL